MKDLICGFSWLINKINIVITGKKSMRGCKPWPMENKYCVRVNNGQWKTSNSWGKRRSNVDRVGVLRLYKVQIFVWSQFSQAVSTPDSSLVCSNSLRLLSYSTQASSSKNENIRLYFYISISCLSRYNSCILLDHQLILVGKTRKK